MKENSVTSHSVDNSDRSAQRTGDHCPNVLKGYVLPGLPHPLLAPENNPAWQKVRKAYDRIAEEVKALSPDLILIYSTYWASVLGHQIQAQPEPEWTLVDEEWHDLGSIPYKLRIDTDFAKSYNEVCHQRGLHTRTVNYKGFPIDTGSVVALKLINPDNQFSAGIVSSNVYADRAETMVLGKSAAEALVRSGKTAVVIAITSLSNRYIEQVEPLKVERFRSKKDEDWSRKYLEFLAKGRLEDVSQLSRQFHREARVTKKVVNFKPFWWLAAVMGQTNAYKGEVIEFQPIHGTAASLVGLTPTSHPAPDLEFDEDNAESYRGDRGVLSGSVPSAKPADVSVGEGSFLDSSPAQTNPFQSDPLSSSPFSEGPESLAAPGKPL